MGKHDKEKSLSTPGSILARIKNNTPIKIHRPDNSETTLQISRLGPVPEMKFQLPQPTYVFSHSKAVYDDKGNVDVIVPGAGKSQGGEMRIGLMSSGRYTVNGWSEIVGDISGDPVILQIALQELYRSILNRGEIIHVSGASPVLDKVILPDQTTAGNTQIIRYGGRKGEIADMATYDSSTVRSIVKRSGEIRQLNGGDNLSRINAIAAAAYEIMPYDHQGIEDFLRDSSAPLDADKYLKITDALKFVGKVVCRQQGPALVDALRKVGFKDTVLAWYDIESNSDPDDHSLSHALAYIPQRKLFVNVAPLGHRSTALTLDQLKQKYQYRNQCVTHIRILNPTTREWEPFSSN